MVGISARIAMGKALSIAFTIQDRIASLAAAPEHFAACSVKNLARSAASAMAKVRLQME
jgi:hypothetical protein